MYIYIYIHIYIYIYIVSIYILLVLIHVYYILIYYITYIYIYIYFNNFTLPHGCSPVSMLHIFQTPFPKNTPGRLLLIISTVCLPV